MAYCLPPKLAEKLIKAIKDGVVTPEKMVDMTSTERRSLLEGIVGKGDASEVNAQLESKLILKDQNKGMVTWAKQVTGISESTRADLVAKVSKLDRVLDPADKTKFLEDFAAKKFGFEVTAEESSKITKLAKVADEAKTAMKNGEDRMTYGRALTAFHNYVNGLKVEANKIPLKDYLKPENYLKGIENMAGQSKAITASMDLSALFRQGGKAFFTNPVIWAKDTLKTIQDVAKVLGGNKSVMDEVNAEIVSRPTFEKMRTAKLDVGTIEEAFPTALPEKIPLFGRLYKASEVGFTAFLHRLRADIFDKTLQVAESSGIETNNVAELRSIGNMVNSLTGRGNLGRLEPIAGLVNNVFFSPRYLKSQFDVLTAHTFQRGVTPFVRRQAALNLVKIVVGQAVVLTIAKSIQPQSVETDPHGSAFGKVKVKDANILSLMIADGLGVSANRSTTNPFTTFDVSTGEGSLIVLATRLVPLILGQESYTKSIPGKVSPLNSGKYGATNGFDVAMDFLKGKASPAFAALVLNRLTGQDFNGNKPTLGNTLKNLFVPISIQNVLPQNKK